MVTSRQTAPESMEIEALNPGKGSRSSGGRLNPLPCRLSRHLDSASYRTLLRIFSLRLDDEDDEPLEPVRGARQELESQSGCEDSILDRIRGGNLEDNRGNGGPGDLDGNSSGALVSEVGFESGHNENQGADAPQLGEAEVVNLDGNSSGALVSEVGFESGHNENQGADAPQLGEAEVVNCPIKDGKTNPACHSQSLSDEQCRSLEATPLTPTDPPGIADAHDINERLEDEPSNSQMDAPKEQVSYFVNELDQGHDKELGEIDHFVANQIRPSPLSETEELEYGKLRLQDNEDINNGSDKELAPDKIETIEGHDEAFDFNNNTVEGSDSSAFMKLDMNLINQLLDSDVDEDIEEGQIPDEFLSSDLLVEQQDQNEHEKGQALGGSFSCYFSKDEDSSTSLVNLNGINISTGYVNLTESKCKQDQPCRVLDDYKNVNAATSDKRCQTVTANTLRSCVEKLTNPTSPSVNKVGEVQEKKKRKLTEERKAKKKKAKKRKKAEKERRGVKRLKLQPIIKPKVVQHCIFYLKGRCEQGDLCKFSHDTTPLTKSVACKYFVTGSCLKGDDCPYDHNLSKYPCDRFLASGSCIRGDKCKFSHKISETSSSEAVVVNPIPSSTAEKLSSGKQKTISNTFAPVTEVHKGLPQNAKEDHIINTSAFLCDASKTVSPSMKSSTHQVPGSTTKVAKPRLIPNGISFLSFGSEPSNTIHNDKLEKNYSSDNCSQQDPDKFCARGHLSFSSLAGKPLPKAGNADNKMSELTVFGSPGISEWTNLKTTTFNNVTTAFPDSKSIQTDVADASKILDEFLFGFGS